MTTTTEDPIALAEERARRLAMIVEGYEVGEEGMPDGSVPGAARPELAAQRYPCDTEAGKLISHPRYVLVTQYGDKGNYRLRLAKDVRNVEQLAADALIDAAGGELVVCYFDLDELAGAGPGIYDGDVVSYAYEDVAYEYDVVRVDEDLIEGEVARYLCLAERGRAVDGFDDYDHRVHEDEVEVVALGEPDERIPVRYGLAKVVVSVAFNTVPSP